MVENRSYRKSQRRLSDGPSIAGFAVFDLDLRLSSNVGLGVWFSSSSSLAERVLLISNVGIVISTSGEKEWSGVLTLYSEGVSAAESFSGVFERDESGPESVT